MSNSTKFMKLDGCKNLYIPILYGIIKIHIYIFVVVQKKQIQSFWEDQNFQKLTFNNWKIVESGNKSLLKWKIGIDHLGNTLLCYIGIQKYCQNIGEKKKVVLSIWAQWRERSAANSAPTQIICHLESPLPANLWPQTCLVPHFTSVQGKGWS